MARGRGAARGIPHRLVFPLFSGGRGAADQRCCHRDTLGQRLPDSFGEEGLLPPAQRQSSNTEPRTPGGGWTDHVLMAASGTLIRPHWAWTPVYKVGTASQAHSTAGMAHGATARSKENGPWGPCLRLAEHTGDEGAAGCASAVLGGACGRGAVEGGPIVSFLTIYLLDACGSLISLCAVGPGSKRLRRVSLFPIQALQRDSQLLLPLLGNKV